MKRLKKAVTILSAIWMTLPAIAFGGGHPKDCDPPKVVVGPQGPKGDKGDKGATGTPGAAGAAGVAGKNGADGAAGAAGAAGAKGDPAPEDSYDHRLAVNVGAAVQWHEWDNHVSLNSGYRYDINHKDHQVDALIVGYRFGANATDRKLAELEKLVAAQSEQLKKQEELNGALLSQMGAMANQEQPNRVKAVIR